MTETTMDKLHMTYQGALAKSSNILEIVENYYQDLLNQEFPEEDITLVDDFIDGLRGCLQYRRKTFLITNTVTYINIVLMYIISWLHSLKKNMDVELFSRRKALESDLSKILKKSLKHDHLTRTMRTYECGELSANLRDRFGIRCIVLNDSNEGSLLFIYEIFDAIVGILGGKNRQRKASFISWFESSPNIPKCDKDMIRSVLEIPFSIEHVKDFIQNPKEKNGYKTLQFTLRIEMYSDVLPGCQMEVQLRDKEMHENAISGTAAHLDYKLDFDGDEFKEINIEKFAKIFTVDDFSKLHITGFTSECYEHKFSEEDDIYAISNPYDRDGIHVAKVFFNRRISPGLVTI